MGDELNEARRRWKIEDDGAVGFAGLGGPCSWEGTTSVSRRSEWSTRGNKTVARGLGQLELKLLSMAAVGYRATERRGEEWVAGMDRAVLGEVIPLLPAHGDIQASRELRGGAGHRGGHLLLRTGKEEDDTGAGPGPGKRQVSVLHFFLVLFF